jgi:hypothetical protein
MRTVYVLESKSVDKKGRGKNAQFLGVFKTFEEVESAKQTVLEKTKNLIFNVYVSESWI